METRASPSSSHSDPDYSSLLWLRPAIHELLVDEPTSQAIYDQSIRASLCRLVVASQILRLDMETIYTAGVLLHRYVLARGENHTRVVGDGSTADTWNVETDIVEDCTVASCLLIACKIEEQPARLRDLINVASMLRIANTQSRTPDEVGSYDQQRLPVQLDWNPRPPPLDDSYWEYKKRLVKCEQTTLRWLSFDVIVPRTIRLLIIFVTDVTEEGDHYIVMAYSILSMTLFSIKLLQLPAALLAIASLRISLSALEESIPPWGCPFMDSDTKYWLEKYGIDVEDDHLQEIVLDLNALQLSLNGY